MAPKSPIAVVQRSLKYLKDNKQKEIVSINVLVFLTVVCVPGHFSTQFLPMWKAVRGSRPPLISRKILSRTR